MNRYQKYVNALFLSVAIVVWFVTRHYTETMVGYFQLGRKVGGFSDVILHGLPIILGALSFWLLRSNSSAINFTTDSVAELSKVTWPTRRDVILGTVVVIITVILAGIILGILDVGFTALVRTILGA